MKTTRIYLILSAVLLALGLGSCSSDQVSDLQLSGDCLVESITLDTYTGTIDLPSRTISVRLPEVYDTRAMQLTGLRLSAGAKSDLLQGATLDMSSPKVLHVTNGDVYLDWTLSVVHDEAQIKTFLINGLYNGIIDQEAKTITVYVPQSVGVSALVPSITYSANATLAPQSDVAQDFSQPVTYTVVNNSAQSTYTVTVVAIDKPSALFVGDAASLPALDPEARTACQWMLANVPNSLYASFADIQAQTIDLSQCKVIWWHYHVDGGVDGHDAFLAKATGAVSAMNQLRTYYEQGGSFFLTRYATNLPSFIGTTGDDEWTTPNNCWGQDEATAELCTGPWSFAKYGGQENHPLYANLVAGTDASQVYCTDAGYHITNSTAQYHIGTDWGGYDNHAAWEARTSGRILGVGGDGAVVVWEYPAHSGKGAILCIGSGCYDWYSYTFAAGYTELYHRNIPTMTRNAFNHLMN